MRHDELLDQNCAVARASAVLGERWVWPILRSAFNGARRFEDYQRSVGVARNVLSDRLGSLVAHGILDKRPPSGSPGGRREYRLTDKGRALFPVFVALMEWGNDWTGLDDPPVELFHKPCGHRTHPVVACSACGEPIQARDTEPVLGRGLLTT